MHPIPGTETLNVLIEVHHTESDGLNHQEWTDVRMRIDRSVYVRSTQYAWDGEFRRYTPYIAVEPTQAAAWHVQIPAADAENFRRDLISIGSRYHIAIAYFETQQRDIFDPGVSSK